MTTENKKFGSKRGSEEVDRSYGHEVEYNT
jgi:hypothetical protein